MKLHIFLTAARLHTTYVRLAPAAAVVVAMLFNAVTMATGHASAELDQGIQTGQATASSILRGRPQHEVN